MFPELSEDTHEVRTLGRLVGHAERAHPNHRLAAIRARNHVDGHVARLRIVLQEVEKHEAVDVGQPEVERNRRRLQLASHVQCARSSRRHDPLEARLVRGVEQNRREGRIVLDDEDERILAELVAVVLDFKARRKRRGNDGTAIVVARGRSNGRGACRDFGFKWHVKREGRALALC